MKPQIIESTQFVTEAADWIEAEAREAIAARDLQDALSAVADQASVTADIMGSAFGKVGDVLGGVIASVADYQAQRAALDEQVAKKAITQAEKKSQLFCSDISLWEIAMLIQKNHLDPGTDTQTFLQTILQARQIEVLPITIEIAALSTSFNNYHHFDPADRIIAATAIEHKAAVISCDKELKKLSTLTVIW